MSPPMPWWKRAVAAIDVALLRHGFKRIRLAWHFLVLPGFNYRAARWLHRWVLPSRTKASTDTMGDWKRIQALPDDAAPRLVRPKDGPYAELIRRVRLYAQNGAKALAPLLDKPLPTEDGVEIGRLPTYDRDAICQALTECETLANNTMDPNAIDLLGDMTDDMGVWLTGPAKAIHAAYNSPWTVKDGEVYEVVTEPSREEAIQ